MTEREFLEKADAFIAAHEQAMIANIGELVAIRSVEEAPAEGAPFGPGPARALRAALVMAQRLGLDAHDCDGRMGWAELPGREGGHLATITHLDVVPEGNGWTGSPYEMDVREGWLVGRGVMDNKGPSVLCLYAAKFLKDNSIPLRYGLRVLLGTNEETGMGDVDYYLERNPEPLFCFSPDGDFPVCNGEKGIYSGEFTSPALTGNLVEFSGGIAGNVIPDRAFCVVRADIAACPATEHIAASEENGLVRLSARGIGGHAAMPAGTRNAIGLLVDYLLAHSLCSGEENRFLGLLQKLHGATDGSGLGIECSDDKFDPLTCIGGVISFAGGRLRQSINIRYPLATSGAQLTERLAAGAAAVGAAYAPGTDAAPLYIPPENPAIQAMLGAYAQVTGKPAEPFTMGGGTYARHFRNAVSFGPETRGTKLPPFAGPIHGANEGASVAELKEALKIYLLALWRLQDVDFTAS